ncbi:MAG: sulfur carrier protein ThiS [Nitrospirae bacterium]|nr:MAG: sulfur carrier protein ThiS [Nitrospirota bacterium]
MQLTINGKSETLDVSTVLDVLKAKDIDPHVVAIELNSRMIEPEHIATTKVQDGDTLEFLFYMGGGTFCS